MGGRWVWVACRGCHNANNRARKRRKRAAGGPHYTDRQFGQMLRMVGYLCMKCGVHMTKPRRLPLATDWPADHIIPLARQGGNSIGLIQPLCSACNLGKGLGDEDYFALAVAELEAADQFPWLVEAA